MVKDDRSTLFTVHRVILRTFIMFFKISGFMAESYILGYSTKLYFLSIFNLSTISICFISIKYDGLNCIN
jgi:hypothetical protein